MKILQEVERKTPYELVDIGVNLIDPIFHENMEDVLIRAKQAGISKLMLTGVCEKTSRMVSQLAEIDPGFLHFTAGFHPYNVRDFEESSIETFRQLASLKQCVAIGECGLDYSKGNDSFKDVQIEAFRMQVELAVELQKPLFLHECHAFQDFISILSSFGDRLPSVVVHCFTGTMEEAKAYLDMGFYIGLTGFVWRDKLPNGIRYGLESGELPLERLMIETDAPFMFPRINDRNIPKDTRRNFSKAALDLHQYSRSGRNEPCSLAVICELIAGLMNRDPIEVAKITTENAKRVYRMF